MFSKHNFHPVIDRNGMFGSPMWIGDEKFWLLINLETGRVRARVCEDGGGKYDVRVYVSALRLLELKRKTYARLWSLRPFPFCFVQLSDARTLEEAVNAAEAALQITAWPFGYP
jgi:hypothetical protein